MTSVEAALHMLTHIAKKWNEGYASTADLAGAATAYAHVVDQPMAERAKAAIVEFIEAMHEFSTLVARQYAAGAPISLEHERYNAAWTALRELTK